MFSFFKHLPANESHVMSGIYWDRANFGRAGLRLWFVLAYTKRQREQMLVNFGRHTVMARPRVVRWLSIQLPALRCKWIAGALKCGSDVEPVDPISDPVSVNYIEGAKGWRLKDTGQFEASTTGKPGH